MKPNPEQDADMAAFEKWASLPENRFNLGCGSTGIYKEPLTRGAYAGWQAAKADKADSRAMQDAFEQVCVCLQRYIDGYGCRASAGYSLSLAAPFRKTGAK